MAPADPQVFVVDDEPTVRAALASLISAAGYQVRTFASARDFLDSRVDSAPGCLLLDVRLPDLDGLQLQQQLHDTGVFLPVIFMTGFGDIPTSVRAMKAGAFDYLTKPVEGDVLLGTIADALEEEARTRSERVETEELLRRYESLTPREAEVMQHVLHGLLNKHIAREMGISEKTVKVHRSRVMSKMGARRVATLVHYALSLGDLTSRRREAGDGAQRYPATQTRDYVDQHGYAAGSHRVTAERAVLDHDPDARPESEDPGPTGRSSVHYRAPDHARPDDPDR